MVAKEALEATNQSALDAVLCVEGAIDGLVLTSWKQRKLDMFFGSARSGAQDT